MSSSSPKKISFLRLLLTWLRHGDPFIHQYFQGRKVLDVGCGTGRFLKRRPEDFFGVDLSPEMVKICLDQGLSAFEASATSLPYPDGSIEAINCDNIIEHLPPAQAAAMLHEFGRVLRPGGLVLIRSPLGEGIWNTFSHVRPYPPAAIQKLLKTAPESFVRPEGNWLRHLRTGSVYYSGRYFQNRFLYLLSTFWVWHVPWARRHGYVLVLYKA